MSARVNLLLTGASGYLGGTLLEDLISDPKYKAFKIFALVRGPDQVKAVQERGVIPLQFNKSDKEEVKTVLLENNITAVVHLADGILPEVPLAFIEALATVKEKLGPQTRTHFINTSGAKVLSSHGDMKKDQFPLSDLGEDAYLEQKKADPQNAIFKGAHEANMVTLELGDSLGVNSYVVVPATIYGVGRGFGNKLSGNQMVNLLKIGHQTRKMYLVADPTDTWPICHLEDITLLFLTLVSTWLPSSEVVAPHGRDGGFYFAITSNFSWKDVTKAIGVHLLSKGLVDSDKIFQATDEDLNLIAKIIGAPRDMVLAQTAGWTDLRAENGKKLGWEPKLGLKHLMANIPGDSDFVMSELTRLGTWDVDSSFDYSSTSK